MTRVAERATGAQRDAPLITCPACRGHGKVAWRSPFGRWHPVLRVYRYGEYVIECEECDGVGVIADRRVAERRML